MTDNNTFICDECKFTREPHEHRCLEPDLCKCARCVEVKKFAKSLTDNNKPDVIRFLLGEGPIDGVWYGEKPQGKMPFWWRTKLRELTESQSKEIERLKSRIEELTTQNNNIAPVVQRAAGEWHEEKRKLEARNRELEEALRSGTETIHALLEGTRIVNLDEALAYYKSLLSKEEGE